MIKGNEFGEPVNMTTAAAIAHCNASPVCKGFTTKSSGCGPLDLNFSGGLVVATQSHTGA